MPRGYIWVHEGAPLRGSTHVGACGSCDVLPPKGRAWWSFECGVWPAGLQDWVLVPVLKTQVSRLILVA